MITYIVGANGSLNESEVYGSFGEARSKAVELVNNLNEGVAWVYGQDDNEKASTPFWRHWGIDIFGRVSVDGTNIFGRR